MQNDTFKSVSPDEEDAETPGVQVEVEMSCAERFGAFQEDAVSEETAWEANIFDDNHFVEKE